jgi:RNA polymerase sigma-70 factor (ECF subfamily)
LLTIGPSPIVALNRAIALGQREGPDRGFKELQAIANRDRLSSYPFYWAALGEFELRCKRYGEANGHFRSALNLARNEAERRFFNQRLQASQTPINS